jgi:hypothetical protein
MATFGKSYGIYLFVDVPRVALKLFNQNQFEFIVVEFSKIVIFSVI